MAKMKSEQQPNGTWEIVNVPLADVPQMGPYGNKRDAERDRIMMKRFFRQNPQYRDAPQDDADEADEELPEDASAADAAT